jgi:hypothetical protein
MNDKEKYTQSIRELDQIVQDLRRDAKDIQIFSDVPECQRIANVMREAADRLDKASQFIPIMTDEPWHQTNEMVGFNLFRFALCDGSLEKKVDAYNARIQKMRDERTTHNEEKHKRRLERRAQKLVDK